MKKINLFLTAILFAFVVNAQSVATFENLPLAADTFWNGSDLSGGFKSGHAFFSNSYDTTYHSWSSFIYSDKKDSTTAGFGNQTSAITASGFNGSSNYAVAYEYATPSVVLDYATGGTVTGFYITNSTYAYLSMKHGDAFSKKFGGPTGTDPDWFMVTIKGFRHGVQTADSVDFYLADFRSADSTLDYIVNWWGWVDVHSLGNVDSITFHLSSSDNGAFGMNTPAYFCVDNFTSRAGAPVANNSNVTITYAQDTVVNVIAKSVTDTTSAPFTVILLSTPQIPGASAVVNASNGIWYIPATGIVAPDTLRYLLCDKFGQCDSAKVFFNVTGTTSIGEVATLQTHLFPNPFSNSFTVYHSTEVKEITLFDLTGRMILSRQNTAAAQYTVINAETLTTGSYLVRAVSDKGISVTKVVKQ